MRNRFAAFHLVAAIALVTLAAVAALSFFALYPQWESVRSGASVEAPPIRYGYRPSSDDYFYWPLTRKAADGQLLRMDPLNYERWNEPGIHGTYKYSLLLAAVPGLFFSDVESIFIVNNIFFPALNFLLIYFLCARISSRPWLSLVVASVVVGFGRTLLTEPSSIQWTESLLWLKQMLAGERDVLLHNQLRRLPNVMVTTAPTIAFALLMLGNRFGMWRKAGVALVLGLSSAISLPVFLGLAATFVWWTILCFMSGESIRDKLLILTVAAFISIPGLWIAAQGYNAELLKFALPLPADQLQPPTLASFWQTFRFLLALLLLALLIGTEGRLTLAVFLGTVSAYFAVGFVSNLALADRIIIRGMAELLIACLLASIAGARYGRRVASSPLPYLPFLHLTAVVAAVAIWGSLLVSQSKVLDRYFRPYLATSQRDFQELAAWLNRNVRGEDVIVTLDFDLLTNLPSYLRTSFYLPQVIASSTPSAEREERLLETLAFHGLNAKEVEDFICNMGTHAKIPLPPDHHGIQRSLMQLVLYYGRYFIEPIPPEECARLGAAYGQLQSSGFRYRATLWVDSRLTLVRPTPESPAATATARALFENGTYRIFGVVGENRH